MSDYVGDYAEDVDATINRLQARVEALEGERHAAQREAREARYALRHPKRMNRTSGSGQSSDGYASEVDRVIAALDKQCALKDDEIDRLTAHVEALEAREQDAHRAWNEAKGEAFKLRGRVEALEGALREIWEYPHEAPRAMRGVARAALAGEPERCPECRTRFHDRPLAGCPDPWHTVPTGTDT